MRTVDSKDVLAQGDLFDLDPVDGGNAQITYYVRGFNGPFMRVAELGGEDRNDRLVEAREIPTVGTFNRWSSLRNPLNNYGDSFVPDALALLRTHLEDLRTGERRGMSTSFQGFPQDPYSSAFKTTVDFPEYGLFSRASYSFGGQRPGVRPELFGFDLTRLGIIDERFIRRGQDGRVSSFDQRVGTMRLSQEGAESISRVTRQAGISTDPRVGTNVLAERHSDFSAVSMLRGAIPNPENPSEDRVFATLEEAHAAVMAIHAATIEKPE